ncbi:MAG: acetyl-CoA carboxylase biotin carboxyl carrier protein [Desulfuromonadaceae bacterium]|nr:acetyl-CoA carboxylase biotin carboxyl carrier protein [Desulfuromonadaceae bacterium]
MDIKDVKTLIKLVSESDISEFELENEDNRIFIKRGQTEIVQVAAPVQATAAMPAAPAFAAPAVAPAAAAPAVNDKYEKIKSPIVGTFYAAPSPDSPPYVKVGDIVGAGQTLCIVEAMKLMNEIEAEFKCKVVEVVKANAEPVEYGDILFLVEKV